MAPPPTESSERVTVLGRLLATRGVGAWLVLLLLAPLVVAFAARQAHTRLSLPDVGLVVDAELGVEATDARWHGVRQRDRVVALDGQKLLDTADWTKRSLSADTRALTVTFARGEREFTVTANARPIAPLDRAAVWARLVTGAVLMAMGLVAFVLRPGIAATWLLLVLAWTLGLFLLLKMALYFDPALYKQATIYPWVVCTAVGLHFLCYFPDRIPSIVERPRRVLVLYLPVFVAPLVHVLWLTGTGLTQLSTVGTLWGAVATVLVIAVIVTQYRRLRGSEDRESRSKYRALMVGFTGGLLIPGVWNWLRIALDVWNSPWAADYNAIPLVLFIGVTSYAVVRHNAFAIDRFTAAVVGYATTTVLLGAAFAAALTGIPLLLGTSGVGDSPALLVGVTALAFAGFSPAYRAVKRWVDRRFFREQADASQIADALRTFVLAMQTANRDAAIRAAFDALEILKADRAELWLLSGDAKELSLASSNRTPIEDATPVSLDGPLGQALKSGATAGVDDLAPRVFEAKARDELWAKELAMAAPIMVHGVVAGFVGVGRKRSGGGYRLEELTLLTIVAAQLGSVLERTQGDSAQLDRYHLERRLGTGGMAEVFLAWQVGPGGFERKVAIKRPLPHVSEDPNTVAAFLDEARLAAQLQHPNIAQVYDVGKTAESYFIVMEFVDGPSLRRILRNTKHQEKHVPLEVAASIVISILEALEHAHAQTDERGRELRLVHRDITPRNVLISRQGGVKLVDFGIARAQFQLHVTRTGTIKGTLPYMSPEQATGKDVDHRSDLYSTAVVFYELLTGRMAYPHGPSSRRPRRASTLVKEVPKSLDPVLFRAMEHDPAARFASAYAFGQAVKQSMLPLHPAASETVARWLLSVCPEYVTTDSREAVTVIAPSDPNASPEPLSEPGGNGDDDLTVVDLKGRAGA